jgi:hypothetical protein
LEIQAALMQFHNTPFAVVWVPRYAITHNTQTDEYIEELQQRIFGVPVVLIAADRDRKSVVYGLEQDLVDYLSHFALMDLPWEKYTVQ